MAENLLEVRNLVVNVEDKRYGNINLDIKPGETHVLMDLTVQANPPWVMR